MFLVLKQIGVWGFFLSPGCIYSLIMLDMIKSENPISNKEKTLFLSNIL